MKKLVATIVVALFATFAFAQKMQEAQIPASVKSSFQKMYPTAKSVKWDKEEVNYEASFDFNKTDNSVLMDAQGNVIETEVEIEVNQLPMGVLDYVKTHYAGRKAKEGAKITDAQGMITYEVELKGMDLLFDSNSMFIKEIKAK